MSQGAPENWSLEITTAGDALLREAACRTLANCCVDLSQTRGDVRRTHVNSVNIWDMRTRPTRERIVAAAGGLHRRGGLSSVSMRKVARQVGISATAAYRHFQDKQSLIDAVAEGAFSTFKTYLQRPRRGDPLARLCRNYLDFALERGREYSLIFLKAGRQMHRIPDGLAGHSSPSFDVSRNTVEGQLQLGRLRPGDSLEISLGIWAQAHGLVMLYRAGRFDGIDSFRRFYLRVSGRLLMGLRAAPSAPFKRAHPSVRRGG